MHPRHLGIYLVRDNQELKVRFVEIQKLQENDKRFADLEGLYFFDFQRRPSFWHFQDFLHESFNDYLIEHMCINRKAGELIREDLCFQDEDYYFFEIPIHLLTDFNKLIRQLGPLDGAAQYYRICNDERLTETNIHFTDQPASFTQEQFAEQLLHSKSGLQEFARGRSLIKTIGEWMIREVKEHPQELAAYQPAVTELEKLLQQTETEALTTTMHDMTYVPEIRDFVKQQPMFNDVMKQVFDVSLKADEKEKLLLAWIEEQYAPRPEKSASQQTLFAGKRSSPENSVSNWFANHDVLLRRYWHQTLDTICWQPGFNSAPYVDKLSAEIIILKDSKLFLNSDGLMELDYHDHYLFNSEYSKEACGGFTSLLGPELMKACKYLGLEFQPDTDFEGHPVFTAESTRKLMDAGYHLTKEYCLGKLNRLPKEEAAASLSPA